MKHLVLILLFIASLHSLTKAQETIDELLIDAMSAQLTEVYKNSGYRFNVRTKWVPEQIRSLRKEDFESVKFVNSSPRGYEMVYVSYNSPRGLKKATSQVYIELEQRVPVAKQQLNKGDAIDSTLVEYRWVDVTRFRGAFIEDLSTLQNKAVDRIIKKGQGILKTDIIEAPIVTAGDYVNLIYRQNGINVVIPCIARQSKAVGEQIKLMNKETGKVYVGILISPSSAQWERTL